MKYKQVMKLQSGFVRRMIEIFDSALRLGLSSQELTKRLVEIYKDPNFDKIPRYSREFVYGYQAALTNRHHNQLVYAYIVDGKTLTIGSEEYEKISARVIQDKHGKTGHFVYRFDNNKRYTEPDSEQ